MGLLQVSRYKIVFSRVILIVLTILLSMSFSFAGTLFSDGFQVADQNLGSYRNFSCSKGSTGFSNITDGMASTPVSGTDACEYTLWNGSSVTVSIEHNLTMKLSPVSPAFLMGICTEPNDGSNYCVWNTADGFGSDGYWINAAAGGWDMRRVSGGSATTLSGESGTWDNDGSNITLNIYNDGSQNIEILKNDIRQFTIAESTFTSFVVFAIAGSQIGTPVRFDNITVWNGSLSAAGPSGPSAPIYVSPTAADDIANLTIPAVLVNITCADSFNAGIYFGNNSASLPLVRNSDLDVANYTPPSDIGFEEFFYIGTCNISINNTMRSWNYSQPNVTQPVYEPPTLPNGASNVTIPDVLINASCGNFTTSIFFGNVSTGLPRVVNSSTNLADYVPPSDINYEMFFYVASCDGRVNNTMRNWTYSQIPPTAPFYEPPTNNGNLTNSTLLSPLVNITCNNSHSTGIYFGNNSAGLPLVASNVASELNYTPHIDLTNGTYYFIGSCNLTVNATTFSWNFTPSVVDPPVYQLPTPPNNNINNTIPPVLVNITCQENTTAAIYFGTVTNSLSLVRQTNFTEANYTPSGLVSDDFFYQGSCNFTSNNTVRKWVYDITKPIIQINVTNQTLYLNMYPDKDHFNLTFLVNVTDERQLNNLNVSIDSQTIYFQNLSNASFGVIISYNILNLTGNHSHNLTITAADSHTAQELRKPWKWIIETGVVFKNKLKYQFPEGNYIQTQKKGGSLLDKWTSAMGEDRFYQNFTPLTPSETVIFIERSDTPIQIVKDHTGDYKGEYIVTGWHWKDYVLIGEPESKVKITRIDLYTVEVEISKIYNRPELLEFSSIGDLNVVTATYQFMAASLFINSSTMANNMGENIVVTEENIIGSCKGVSNNGHVDIGYNWIVFKNGQIWNQSTTLPVAYDVLSGSTSPTSIPNNWVVRDLRFRFSGPIVTKSRNACAFPRMDIRVQNISTLWQCYDYYSDKFENIRTANNLVQVEADRYHEVFEPNQTTIRSNVSGLNTTVGDEFIFSCNSRYFDDEGPYLNSTPAEVVILGIDNCTTFNSTAFNFTLRNVEDNEIISTNNVSFTVLPFLNSDTTLSGIYSDTLFNKPTYNFCKFPNQSMNANMSNLMMADGFNPRLFQNFNVPIDGDGYTGYMLPVSSTTTNILYVLTDASFNRVGGATMVFHRNVNGTQVEVFRSVSDGLGQVLAIQDQTVTYFVNISHPDFPLKELNIQPILTTYTIKLSTTGNELYNDTYKGIRYKIDPPGTLFEVNNQYLMFNFTITGTGFEYFGINLTGHGFSCIPTNCGNISTSSTGGVVSVAINISETGRFFTSLFFKKPNERVVYINSWVNHGILGRAVDRSLIQLMDDIRDNTTPKQRAVIAALINIMLIGVGSAVGMLGMPLMALAVCGTIFLSLPQVGYIHPFFGLLMVIIGSIIFALSMQEKS